MKTNLRKTINREEVNLDSTTFLVLSENKLDTGLNICIQGNRELLIRCIEQVLHDLKKEHIKASLNLDDEGLEELLREVREISNEESLNAVKH